MIIDRRTFFLATALTGLTGAVAVARPAMSFDDLRARLGVGGRLGLAAIHLGSGKRLASDAHGRFSMASTFKLALAGAVLAEVDAGCLSLSEQIAFTPADLVTYAPVIKAEIDRGSLPVETLCAAIVQVSDNTAANLLLKKIGGPPALTRFFRSCGDRFTRLDRYEPELNSNLPGDPRDTTTPAAMLGTMRALLVGNRLKPSSRALLDRWMIGTTTGLNMLRAGLPNGWIVGDKTGRGARGSYNDLAIAWSPRRAPILIAAFLDGGTVANAVRDSIHQDIARRVAARFT